ncbi:unnamed protein product [Pleuronectes platessa]|uniref:Uncharacterized protein n=1 Tax=Pleuronectes platessa TaxID=8262 RepID=A0A9N7YXW7_PLEPL|nr:unnamed protein product [Pleuronectes platessa]
MWTDRQRNNIVCVSDPADPAQLHIAHVTEPDAVAQPARVDECTLQSRIAVTSGCYRSSSSSQHQSNGHKELPRHQQPAVKCDRDVTVWLSNRGGGWREPSPWNTTRNAATVPCCCAEVFGYIQVDGRPAKKENSCEADMPPSWLSPPSPKPHTRWQSTTGITALHPEKLAEPWTTTSPLSCRNNLVQPTSLQACTVMAAGPSALWSSLELRDQLLTEILGNSHISQPASRCRQINVALLMRESQ